MSTLELCAVLVQMEPVREMKWDPRAHRLVIVTGSERVYVWTPEGRVSSRFLSRSFEREPCRGIRTGRIRARRQGYLLLRVHGRVVAARAENRASFASFPLVYTLYCAFDVYWRDDAKRRRSGSPSLGL